LMTEVSDLKHNLCEKQAKIESLESELATLKGNYKTDSERQGESIIELKQSTQKICKKIDNLKKYANSNINDAEQSNTKRSDSENNGNSLEHVLTNQNQSEVNNNQQIVLEDNSNSEFVGVARRVVKRLYLGGAREGATSELVTEYMERKGISPTVKRIFKSKRKGTVAIRVNVNSTDYERVLQNDFWPENVYARPWVSQAKWQDKNKET
ncbi:Hypothetical predicted protein, partial [Paramuricea clavata]